MSVMCINSCREGASRTEPGSVCGGVQRQDQRQQAQPETLEDLSEHQKALFLSEGNGALAQDAQTGCVLKIFTRCLDTVLGNRVWVSALAV